MSPDTHDPLELEPEAMRRLGYRAVDLLVDRLVGLDPGPAWHGADRAELEERLREPPPAGPDDEGRLLERLVEDVLPFAGHHDHPRFFAFVPSCPTWPSILGDFIAAGANIFAGTWLQSAGASTAELVVIDWFRQWLGWPPQTSGILLPGGSQANLTALACARDTTPGARSSDAVIYVSSQGHSSVTRAIRVIGFDEDQVRAVPVDAALRMRTEALTAAMEADRDVGRRPFLVVANAGATNTGAVDPLEEIAAACAAAGVWLHVDAAYGGFAVLTERGREWLRGIEAADSITLDPHKWLYQPYEAGCLLVREGTRLGDAFQIMPDYLQDTAVAGRDVNFADRGIQLSRSARALKLWLSIKYFGVDAFRAAIDRSLDVAVHAQELVEESSVLELVSPATLGIVCFRRRFEGLDEGGLAQANADLAHRLAESGEGMVSSTRVDGRYALRMCVLNHRSGPQDVERVLHWLETA
ncbi:MAG TPA: aminotransferase class I/II-fold pyridoxal phosphate-dependent enzyme [Gaiellaceae bacterium]|nr:aminotransferase class I/II-fold pyridoxal phosphate-dependent enzyme [Gaiellaceae bacterium]